MSRDWSRRTFDAGTRRLRAAESSRRDEAVASRAEDAPAALSHREQEERLRAIAETWTRCAKIASGAEEHDADPSTLRFMFAFMARESWLMLESHRQSPLEEAEGVARSVSSSGDAFSPSEDDAGRPDPTSPSPLAPVLDIGRAVRDAYGLKVPEPQSLRVGPPKLGVVDGDSAA